MVDERRTRMKGSLLLFPHSVADNFANHFPPQIRTPRRTEQTRATKLSETKRGDDEAAGGAAEGT